MGECPPPPDHQISETRHRVVDATTGAVITPPAPAPPAPTHLASQVALPTAESAPPAPPVLSHHWLAGEGPLRWRRQLRCASRNLVIVFIGPQYGIFDITELLVLLGRPPTQIPPHLGSATEILHRYGCTTAT